MTRRFAYDESEDPPAPVLPLLVAAPGSDEAVLVPSLVDTGADCTLVPAEIARCLRLPLVDRLFVEGLSGAVRRAPVSAAVVHLPRSPLRRRSFSARIRRTKSATPPLSSG